MKKEYRHFCPLARALELVGEKWSLLIVRDLLRGPQRFSDLQRYLHNITPKRLTERLRELEQNGIVRRSDAGYEVLYELTPLGEGLRESVESLIAWGIGHTVGRPHRETDRICPEQTLYALSVWFNRHRIRPGNRISWLLQWGENDRWALEFDGKRWTQKKEAAHPTLLIRVSARAWISLLAAPDPAKMLRTGRLRLEGSAPARREFRNIMSRYRRPIQR